MLNLILSVIVEAAMVANAEDEAMKVKETKKNLRKAEERLIELCKDIDSDQSGMLSLDEFMTGFCENKEFEHCLRVMGCDLVDLHMIFSICDEDCSGDVDYEEFVNNFRRMQQ